MPASQGEVGSLFGSEFSREMFCEKIPAIPNTCCLLKETCRIGSLERMAPWMTTDSGVGLGEKYDGSRKSAFSFGRKVEEGVFGGISET